MCSVSYTATLFITLVLIFIDIKLSLCLPVWFCFYQLCLCSVSYTATLFITLVLILIDIEHSMFLLVWFCFYQLGLYCAQSVIQLLYLSLWNWYFLISNIHFVCQFDFAFIKLVCAVFSQLYSYPIYHFGIDIDRYRTFTLSACKLLILSTWFVFSQLYSYSVYHFGINIFLYRTFTLSAGMIFLLSTWFVFSQLYSYSIYHFGIDIFLYQMFTLPASMILFYQLGLCSVSCTATVNITMVLIFIDIECSFCLPVWFCFHQLSLTV